MRTDWGQFKQSMKCMGCGKEKTVDSFVRLEVYDRWTKREYDAWRSKYCNGACFDRRYGDLISHDETATYFLRVRP